MLPHFQATTGYHPLPQINDDDPEKAIAIGDVSTDKKKEPHTPIAKNALTLLAVILMLGVALAGKQAWATFAARHARCGFRAYCGHGDIAPLQQNRTYSSEVVGEYRNGLRTHYMLPSGDAIPTIALGVWKADPGEVGNAVKAALAAGYRHIDNAWIYKNEAEVGQALKESGIPRKDIWLTSKLWNTFHEPKDVEPALDESLRNLGTDYLDLYLVHWPVAQYENGSLNVELTQNPYPTWQKLEELVKKGKIRNIGVSNFNIKRIQNLTANDLKIRPAVNQVELNFWNPQPELLQWSEEHNLLLEAYSPLGSSSKVNATLTVPEVKEIAKAMNITPAQVIISWHLQRGTVVLPKSVTPSRIEENFHVRKLPQDLFDKLERAAVLHPPERSVDPGAKWGVDIFG